MSSVCRYHVIPVDDVVVRGSTSPWSMMRDEVARRLLLAPNKLSITDVLLAPRDFARLNDEARVWTMRGLEEGPRCTMKRGVPAGFAFVPRVLLCEVAR